MLHRETVSTELLELLKELRSIPALAALRLVGGTSLALQLGHRNSVDIDLFGKLDDADLQPMPVMFNDISWEAIKTEIKDQINAFQ